MRSINEVNADLDRVQEELKNVHGTSTEVYTRIVGYYRSVRNWNKGKREEYNHRKLFVTDDNQNSEKARETFVMQPEITSVENSIHNVEGESYYEIYTRNTCPNCPPVKDFCTSLPFSGYVVDVDTEEGFAKASSHGVFSAPTVIFFDSENQEISRAHSVRELQTMVANEAKMALV